MADKVSGVMLKASKINSVGRPAVNPECRILGGMFLLTIFMEGQEGGKGSQAPVND